jgi:hypothetical protein
MSIFVRPRVSGAEWSTIGCWIVDVTKLLHQLRLLQFVKQVFLGRHRPVMFNNGESAVCRFACAGVFGTK